ncbi:MAG TPA: hypothetical protein PK833_03215 [Vicingus sp.]|nr:hypothetical protein [Vicingus sp.]
MIQTTTQKLFAQGKKSIKKINESNKVSPKVSVLKKKSPILISSKKIVKMKNLKFKKKNSFLKLKALRSVKIKALLIKIKKLQVRFGIKNLLLKKNFKKNLKRIFKY